VLAQSHSNQVLGGSTLPVVMLRSRSFVPSLATAQLHCRPLREEFWQAAHSSKPRKDAAPNRNFEIGKEGGVEEEERVGKGLCSVRVTYIPFFEQSQA